jgi:hypothetical protein
LINRPEKGREEESVFSNCGNMDHLDLELSIGSISLYIHLVNSCGVLVSSGMPSGTTIIATDPSLALVFTMMFGDM